MMSARIYRGTGFMMVLCSVILLSLLGCTKENQANDVSKPDAQVVSKKDNDGKMINAQPVGLLKEKDALTFKELILKEQILLDPPDEDEKRPPDLTCTGKNTGKIFESIEKDQWDKVLFHNSAGKRIRYQAVISTELGEIQADLLGDVAPNHVRNFICLARTGYFDGMKFYYSLNDKVEDNIAAYIETGCPRGTGEPGSGSIGYWLRPEIHDRSVHEEGMLGACLNGGPNTASSRFYITAARMPQMDGDFTIFGKVNRGMDIVRTINTRAVYKESDDALKSNHLKEPVLIRNVTILTTLE